jgi:AraC-like DNA-binding protein
MLAIMTDQLIAKLSRFAARDNRPSSDGLPTAPVLGAFIARDRERIADLEISATGLIILIDGIKEVSDLHGSHLYRKGDALLLPAGWRGTVVNEPDSVSGVYRSLILMFPADMVRRLLHAHANAALGDGRRARDYRATLTSSLTDAVLHAADGLSGGSPVSPQIIEHRCMEVLLALLENGVWWLGPVAPTGIADAVRALVRVQPDQPWTADSVARALNLSSATLRRRLSEEDSSVRRIMTEERVAHARRLLEVEGRSVQEAAEACGYASRSHFARQIKDATGSTPSELRSR